MFASELAGHQVELYIDNTAAEAVMANMRSRHKACRAMLRRLNRRCLQLGIELVVRRVSTVENVVADACTRPGKFAGLTHFSYPHDGWQQRWELADCVERPVTWQQRRACLGLSSN